VRIWDLDPALLCDRHLLGEHRELHAVWAILTTGKRGYAHHPENAALARPARHDAQVSELRRRSFRHASPLDPRLATGAAEQTELVDSVEDQRERLMRRGCDCSV
jgi:hypothetical protein